MTLRHHLSLALGLLLSVSAWAQPASRWQQRISYEMDIQMDAPKHQYKGTQRVVYYNNSPDVLDKVFYHLYFNAFQPGSMMDVRSRTIQDPDPRVSDRISKLKKDEIGYLHVNDFKHNGQAVAAFHEEGTILEVKLANPIQPGDSAVFEMKFEAQVPLQVRRSGRDSEEGVEFSMSQWYPKLAEYDYQGWHANPYIGREFHGVWGNFDVKITMDKDYILAGTGYLQNNNEIGYGYEDSGVKVDHSDKKTLTWHFFAPNVHDFVWAADPDYIHEVASVDDTLKIHFFYQDEEDLKINWRKAQDKTVRAFKFIQKRFGNYPYRQYSVIQGGDGGMEYPMATLITGKRNLGSLVGVIVHEVMHTWYQMLLATNESLYPWMDEGFTSYASNIVMGYLFNRMDEPVHSRSYAGYRYLAKSGQEEPMTTHADHYSTNFAYGQAAYSKGAVFIAQLEYIVGKQIFDQALLDYYDQWHFKHPNPNDFIRVFEKNSGLELDWYKEYFVHTTHQIDYSIDSVAKARKNTLVQLKRVGKMPMPIEVVVEYEEKGATKKELFYIPMRIMRGEKADEGLMPRTVLPDWPWTNATYTFEIPVKYKKIKRIQIDPTERMADVNLDNNAWES